MNVIRKTRKSKHISVKEMADLMQLPVFVYWYYEHFVGEMKYGMVKELCYLLDINYNNIK